MKTINYYLIRNKNGENGKDYLSGYTTLIMYKTGENKIDEILIDEILSSEDYAKKFYSKEQAEYYIKDMVKEGKRTEYHIDPEKYIIEERTKEAIIKVLMVAYDDEYTEPLTYIFDGYKNCLIRLSRGLQYPNQNALSELFSFYVWNRKEDLENYQKRGLKSLCENYDKILLIYDREIYEVNKNDFAIEGE